jgi:hypothetical protein
MSRLPYFLDNQITDGSKTVSLMCQPLFIPRIFLLVISVCGLVDHEATVMLEGLSELKNPMTSREASAYKSGV